MPLIEEAGPVTVDLPRPSRPRGAVALQLGLSAIVGVTCSAIWLAVGGDHSFWPRWVLLPLLVAAADFCVRGTVRRTSGPSRNFALHAVVGALMLLLAWAIWSFSGAPASLWPKWVLLGLLVSLALHLAVLGPSRWFTADREQVLAARVDELTRTRRGALDVQTVELRRIERDLHDGAQARLVALSLKLGRVEDRLRDQPEAGLLVREAHRDADLAIAELRELARGIAPPILADRGLVEAVRALGRRAGIAVAVRADVGRRLPPSVELAAYFIVAEALTNAVKHAGTPTHPATATVTLDVVDTTLVVQVADDGPGGADPLGAGLAGLAQRAAALDGTFTVGDLASGSPGGSIGGTVVRAELPGG